MTNGNFWAQRLGTAPAPTAPAVPAPVAPPTQPWWMTSAPQQHQQAVQQAPAAPQPQPVGQPAPQIPQNGEVPIEVLLSNPNYHTTKPPKSERLADFCPECSSGNYMHIAGQESRAKRCFDCGYNPMFGHTTAGVSATSKDIPVYTARGQAGNVNNFNPQKIIGRV